VTAEIEAIAAHKLNNGNTHKVLINSTVCLSQMQHMILLRPNIECQAHKGRCQVNGRKLITAESTAVIMQYGLKLSKSTNDKNYKMLLLLAA